MNLTDSKYSSFALVKEMLETPDIIRKFDWTQTANMAKAI
ncbi:MAG: sugar isomerase, partial [Planctomycetaceae bacterium]|nr:sugar isomerase [Planctomycetaceae bacterium]